MAAGTGAPPSDSSVGAKAVREFDGMPEADPLIDVLADLDDLVRR